MLKTLKDLALALINATLILLVLCLFLTWKVVNKADHVATNFAGTLVAIQPLRDDISGAAAELAALRKDVAQISEQSGDVRSGSLQRIEARLEQIEDRMDDARQSVKKLSQAPARLVDHAIDKTGDRLAQGVMDVRGCVPPHS